MFRRPAPIKLTVDPLLFLSAAVGAATALHFYLQQKRVTAPLVLAVENGTSNHDANKEEQAADTKFDIPDALLENSKYAKELQVAVALALQAGQSMIGYCNDKGTASEDLHDLGIETKGAPEDFCTKIDVENEQLITQRILAEFPSHDIIGEEDTGTNMIKPLTEAPTWIIDPIDGTTNFSRGLPLVCVSIGFCVKRKPVLGVVFSPMTQELYLAVRGRGAFRNGVALTKRSNKEPKALKDAVVCAEFGYARTEVAVSKMVGAVQNIMIHGVQAMRQYGCGVLDLCYVATGRLDAVYAGLANEGWKPWDYCAGYVISQETGCAMEAIDIGGKDDGSDKPPTEFNLYSQSLICATSRSLLLEIRQVLLSEIEVNVQA